MIAGRTSLKPDCTTTKPFVAPATESAAGGRYARYLVGAAAFYGGDFEGALSAFGALVDAKERWLRETARYMSARVALNQAQVGAFDQYGSFEGVKVPAALDVARNGFEAYLKDYPQGRYAGSARGLLRRLDWLGGRQEALTTRYAALMRQAEEARGLSDVELAQEIDNKLLAGGPDGERREVKAVDPLMLAVIDLQRMRDGGKMPGGTTTAFGRAELLAQEARFAGQEALFGFLRATHALHVENAPGEVLRLIPEERVQSSLGFSRQLLRGMASEASGGADTRPFLLRLLPQATRPDERPAVELAIAHHDERAGAIERVFAPGSPVQSPILRTILLENVADAGLLRRQATTPGVPEGEKRRALLTLLWKEVSRAHHADFIRDLALVPAKAPTAFSGDVTIDDDPPLGLFTGGRWGDYGCAELRATATTLASRGRDPRAQLCLAEFVRTNDLDGMPLDTQPAKDELGGTPSRFPGPAFARMNVYRDLIARTDVGGEDKAFALYRAVQCYAPSGYDHCGGPELPLPVRRGWFQQLKRDYPTSRWARELRYYW